MKRVQIFSPHIDDAILSLGGSILNWRSIGHEVIVRNIFTISNWTHSKPLSGKKYGEGTAYVSDLRRNEELRVAEHLDIAVEFWEFLDFPLREGYSVFERQKMEDEIAKGIAECLNSEDSFFFPLGIGHPDHLLLRTMCNKLISDYPNIFFYEDLPYYAWGKFEYVNENLSLQEDNLPIVEKIDFKEKEKLVRNYDSQITESFIRDIRSYSYNMLDNSYYERFWQQLSE